MKSLFTPKDVVRLIGISYRQLQYWDKTNFIRPTAIHMGKYRHYTFVELLQLKLAKVLREHSVSIQKLRRIINSIQELLAKATCPLVDCSFLFSGNKVFLFNGDVLMDAVTTDSFYRFDVRSLREDIDNLYPSEAESSEIRKIPVAS